MRWPASPRCRPRTARRANRQAARSAVAACKAPCIAFSRCSGPICRPSATMISGSVTPMKPKIAPQIGFQMLQRRGRRAGAVKAAARDGDDDALVARQPFRPGGAIAEGLSRHHDAVDPGLELAGNGEVVHRRADHHGVRRQEFLQHRLAGGDFLLHRRAIPVPRPAPPPDVRPTDATRARRQDRDR